MYCFNCRYELKNFQDVKVREFDVTDVTLDDRIELESDWPKKKKRQRSGKIVNYVVNETLYFGKGHSVATGSRVTLVFDNGTDVDFRWGLFRTTPVLHKLRINYDDFPPDAVVNVDIVATKVDRKTEYSAILVNWLIYGQRLFDSFYLLNLLTCKSSYVTRSLGVSQ